jgi:hypothetical protein
MIEGDEIADFVAHAVVPDMIVVRCGNALVG